MKIKFTAIASLTIVAASTLILGSCTADADSSGLEYMPDMYRSPAIEPYVDYGEIRGRENKDFKMKLSALTPPSNTIPYYGTDSATVMLMLPYHRKANLAFKETHGMYNADLTANDEYAAAAVDVAAKVSAAVASATVVAAAAAASYAAFASAAAFKDFEAAATARSYAVLAFV